MIFSSRRPFFAALTLLATLALAAFSPLAAQGLWIEAESLPNPPAQATFGWARPELQSGGKVLALNLDARNVEAAIPEEGLVIAYPFKIAKAGEHTLWNRVVFEGIRAPFEWRVGGGEWTLNSQKEQPVTNVQELAFWNPVGWTRLGSANLSAGDHTLEIRLTRAYDKDKKIRELRYISDVIHITPDEFRPNFAHRPGAGYPGQSAEPRVFTLPARPAADDAPRRALELTGVWQFAPYDEIGEIDEQSRVSGADAYPDTARLSWYDYAVPSIRESALPELAYSHRYVVRTFVDLPADARGAAQLTFESLTLISSLFVNGSKAGDFSIVKGRWQVDVTPWLKPGARNEILLVMKDAYYALAESEGATMRRSQYYPASMFQSMQGINWRFDFPVGNGQGASGILDIVKLELSAGPLHVADTFVKPFPTTRREIEIDTTVRGVGDAARSGVLRRSIRTWPEGKPVATLPEQPFALKPGETSATLTAKTSSEPLTLWWTYQPALYELVTDVVANGVVTDRAITRFGNREWEIRGNQFYLNGVRQHLRADLTHNGGGGDRERARAAIEEMREIGVNMFRRRFQTRWHGANSTREILEVMDESGMPVRQNAGTFDGQVASYRLVDKGELRKELFVRWHEQMLNGVLARRNHPSVFIWELDNELVFINARNFGWARQVEPEFTRTSNAILALDPTRSTVLGGGRALLDDSLPTYGVHYFEVADRHYPNEAYTAEKSLAAEGVDRTRPWPLHADKKPVFFSETAFLPGRNAAGFAAVGGETTFLGKRESRPAIGRIASWLAEGYRWHGFAANHVWFHKDFSDGSFTYAWQPVAILRRQWRDTFGPQENVVRDLRVYNDLPDTSPITARWTLEVGGKRVSGETKTFNVAPGEFEPWTVTFTTPRTRERQPGFFRLTAERGGKQVFEHAIAIEIVPEPEGKPAKLSGPLVVWDPEGTALQRLKDTGYKIDRTVTSLAEIPDAFGLLVVGRNAIPAESATDRRWLALTAAGNRIVFLEQAHPIHYQAVPADYSPAGLDGTIAFSQNLDHPIFDGVAQSDLDFWAGGDDIVYRNALQKPSRGAVSLVQCDDALAYSALLQIEADNGINIVSQLAIGEKLAAETTARRLFDNMVRYAGTYKKTVRDTALVVQSPELAEAVTSSGATFTRSDDPIKALSDHIGGLLIVEGTPSNLAALAARKDLLEKTWAAGGWLLVSNVTPESLDAFNRIVGQNHLLRPFRQELVRFPAVRDPLTAGLTQRDVVMSSGRRIQWFNSDEWPTDDAFAHIVDLEDVAPFAEFPSPAYWNDPGTTGPGDDTWPLNMVNGFTIDTHWRMIFSIHLANGDPTRWTMKLPRREKIREVRILPNRNYHKITEIQLTFDGDPTTTRSFEIDPADELAVLTLPEAVEARDIEVNLSQWTESGNTNVIGIDNLEIYAERPASFAKEVRPMLNIGGLVNYPRGKGGVLLSQYVFRAQEANPVNREKKRTVLSTLLRNLGAPFGGQGIAVAGFNLRYAPLSMEDHANLYLTRAQGWPTREGDLSALPRGENTFAGVRYAIRDFATSPLESALTLKHSAIKSAVEKTEITGIRVGTRADSLFFLHGYIQTREWKPSRQSTEPPAAFAYVVRYEDGSTRTIEVKPGVNVAHWLQTTAAPLPEAEIAWQGEAPGARNDAKATLYQFQWDNPTPNVAIASIDLVYGPDKDRWGAPLLLGVTAARIEK